jgi:hypothetical protein
MENSVPEALQAPVQRQCPGAHLAPSKIYFGPLFAPLNFWAR